MAIRSVRIQTSENQKKTLNFLFLSFCVHIHKERERDMSDDWLRIVGFWIMGPINSSLFVFLHNKINSSI